MRRDPASAPRWRRDPVHGVCEPLVVLLGALAVFAMTWGMGVLDPRELGFLVRPPSPQDPWQHYLGWCFFRHDVWRMPPGASPMYGMEIGASVALSDSLPLFAIPMKLIAPWWPDPGQYFGVWLLCCHLLMAWFGWKVCALYAPGPLGRVAGAWLVLLYPPFLGRLGYHMALGGLWVLVAAWWLALRPGRERWDPAWVVLVAVVSAIHGYLLAMVLVIWSGSLAVRRRQGRLGSAAALAEVAGVGAAAMASLWLCGFFVIGSGFGSGGFGYFKANLLGMLDPQMHSAILPKLPRHQGEAEGFAYLGVGAILLAAGAVAWLPQWIRTGGLRRWWPLVVPIAASAVFALSNRVGIGAWEFTYPLPGWALEKAAIFRASGRFMWVPGLLVVIGSVALWSRRMPRWSGCAAAVAVAVQCVDMRPMFESIRGLATVSRAEWPGALSGDAWDAIGARYRAVRRVPLRWAPPEWERIGDFAARWRMATDAANLSRSDETIMARTRATVLEALERGDFDPGTVYLLDRPVSAVVSRVLGPQDWLGSLGGFNVLLPGAKAVPQLVAALPPGPPEWPDRIEPGTTVRFGRDERRDYLLGGWSAPESGWVWTDGATARMVLPVHTGGQSGPFELAMQVGAFVNAHQRATGVDVVVNDRHAKRLEFHWKDPNPAWRRIPIPDDAVRSEGGVAMLVVDVMPRNPRRPCDLGLGTDARWLGVAVHALRVEVVDGPAATGRGSL